MNTLSLRTVSANAKTVKHDWHIIDAEGQILGRLASKVAGIIKGKNKTYYTPHVDCGDYVIVLNADKVRLTGNKLHDKEYLSYSGYTGGQKSIMANELLVKKPTMVVEKAVRGMLPKTKLGKAMIKKLLVYAGTEHPHTAQKPKTITL